MSRALSFAVAFAAVCAMTPASAVAADIAVLTTGAPSKVVQAVANGFAAQTGHRLTLVQDTAGGVRRRVEAGEQAAVIVATPDVLDALTAAGRVVPGTRTDFARTGVGVGVKDGMPKPDISSVDAFKRFLVAAPTIAMPDPKAGGTSAIYLAGLIERLGMADVVRPKAKLKAGGYAADLIVSGEAVTVIHQISEILPVKGVTLVGPLPAEIQLTTTYSAALATSATNDAPARAFLAALAGPAARAATEAAGMESPWP